MLVFCCLCSSRMRITWYVDNVKHAKCLDWAVRIFIAFVLESVRSRFGWAIVFIFGGRAPSARATYSKHCAVLYANSSHVVIIALDDLSWINSYQQPPKCKFYTLAEKCLILWKHHQQGSIYPLECCSNTIKIVYLKTHHFMVDILGEPIRTATRRIFIIADAGGSTCDIHQPKPMCVSLRVLMLQSNTIIIYTCAYSMR